MSLYKNTVIIQDSITKDVVLVASFTPFSELKKLPEDFQAMEKLSTELIGVSRHASPVTNNKAHQDGGGLGHMFAMGWRIGFSGEFSFQRYVPQNLDGKMKKKEALTKWRMDQDTITWMVQYCRDRFKTLSSLIFEHANMEVKVAGIPSLEDLDFQDMETEENVFVNNLTYSCDDFSNVYYQDNDYNTYTYGIWMPVHSDTSALASIADGFRYKGGQFLIAPYKICVDFGRCDGITELIWRGKLDSHRILLSSSDKGYTRIGTSVQISNRLVQAITKARLESTAGKNVHF
jgi:hypothetical protein